ncbi:MAG: hypothetical protein NZM25_07350 [Leptospiraceae bacterium]|nr:hypothetical protein [Leptospiraceae bacterium]
MSSATPISPANASYTLTAINTSGSWRVAVCNVTGLAGGAMDTFRIRVGVGGSYNLSIDAIEFLDNSNNHCDP